VIEPAAYRVVVAEDDIRDAVELQPLLQRAGCEVMIGDYTTDLVQRAHQFRPHLILLDLTFYCLYTGTDLLRQLRSRPGTRASVIAILANRPEGTSGEKILRQGADHLISKPIDHDGLLRFVHRIDRRGVRPTLVRMQAERRAGRPRTGLIRSRFAWLRDDSPPC